MAAPVTSPYSLNPASPYVNALTPPPAAAGATPTVGAAPTNPFPNNTGTGAFANTPQPTTGAPGTFQAGSPNDPASQGNGQAADNYALQMLQNGNAGTDLQGFVDRLNAQFGLPIGKGFQYYPNKGAPPGIIAAAGGGYYAIGPDGKWGYNVGDSGGGSTSNTGTPTGSAAYIPGQGVAGQGTVFGANNPLTPAMSAYEAQLVAELGPNSTNPAFSTDPNSPIIANQVGAYNTTQQQGERNTLSQLAEAGGPNTNLTAQTASLGEKAAQNTAGYQAQLMQQQLTARQQEIEQVLSLYGNTLTQEQQMQLQEELAQLQLAQQAYQNGITNQYNQNALTLQYGG